MAYTTLTDAIEAVSEAQKITADWGNSVKNLLNALRTYAQELTPMQIAKVADETVNNSATLQNDNEFSWTLAASTTYRLTGQLLVSSNATADFKMGWTYPTSTTISYSVLGYNTSDSFQNTHVDQTTVPGFNGGGHGAINSLDTIGFDGLIVTSTTSGTLQLQWAQNTANASNTIVKANSFISLLKVA